MAVGDPIKASRYVNLKAKVKAEMNRRCHTGSVAAYGGTSYDYSVVPATGGAILKEHRDKILDPLRAVNSDVIPAPVGYISDAEITNAETRVNAWATRGLADRTASDCKSGCTGTCNTSCTTGCYTGCTGGCNTGCSGGCDGCDGCDGCGSGCDGGCSGCGDCGGRCSNCGGCGSSCSSCTGGNYFDN